MLFVASGSVVRAQSADASKPDAPAGTQQAQTPEPAPMAPVTPEFRAKIIQFLQASHAMDRMDQAMKSMSAQLRPMIVNSLPPTPKREEIADAYLARLQNVMHTPEAMDQFVALYAHYLTPADIDAAVKFYSTPEGTHILEASEKMQPEAMKLGTDLVTNEAPKVMKSLCKDYPELQDDARVCGPAENKDKSELRGGSFSPAGK
jgi:hypothetical protein